MSWLGNPSHHTRANMFRDSPRALYSGFVKIKGVFCDLLICSTLITWDPTFRQAQWASCDGTLENINEFLDHLRLSTSSSAMDPHMKGTSKLMSTSITLGQELRRAFGPSHDCVLRWYLTSISITWGQALHRAQRTLKWWYFITYFGLAWDQVPCRAQRTLLRSSTNSNRLSTLDQQEIKYPTSTSDSLVVKHFV